MKGKNVNEERGYINIKADSAEINLSYRLSKSVMKRVLKLFGRVANKKLLKQLFCQSGGVSRKK